MYSSNRKVCALLSSSLCWSWVTLVLSGFKVKWGHCTYPRRHKAHCMIRLWVSLHSQEFAYHIELLLCSPSQFAANSSMFSFCFPNKWPSCVRGDISFYTNASIKSPRRLSPALLAFAHNSDLSNPVIWRFSWPACPHFKVRWCNSTYLKVKVGNLADS